ncbi:RNA polymerase sigma factor [Chitinophagaceae bacterium LB-8]|uniref:RNA polymerase sigma factor n=1 Tax=Paraflavisolibacter caeni TaxID=2982496 RepID=A0A9X2XWS0_9BACT|nr:RNA polymerase sigma factor [Paraflavisolibacter caeni]MCU7550500.1 RNA polymerase sigma factor [Paraflavisolibacter caeni]
MEELLAIIIGCTINNYKYQKMLYERFYKYALKIVYRYIYHYDQAVDVVNDGFVKLFQNFQNFESKDQRETFKLFIGWINKIMVNTAIDELRRQHMLLKTESLSKYELEIESTSFATDQQIVYKELIELVRKLPPSYRIVFNMHVIDGYSHHDIAHALGISVGTCKSYLFKARLYLKSYIKEMNEPRYESFKQ